MCRHRWLLAAMVLGLFWLAFAPPSNAQRQKKNFAPKNMVVSPQVHSDHRLTFRLEAPKATEVTVGGDFGQAVTMTKDDKGIWSATIGPLTPDLYSYSFRVDGVKTVDPNNAAIKQGVRSVDSMVFIPGKEADFQDNKDVPHGEVRQVWYRSTTLEMPRRMHVYTPPGYDDNSERYPVFYLLHGGGDEDSGWNTIGRAGFILDNLIAQKKAKPMLVVMPNGSLPRPANLVRPAPGTPPPADFVRRMAEFQQRFTKELLNDVIPQVEKRYRVREGAENRALAGLSMGGGQTMSVVTSNPDKFAYVGVWSAGVRDADDFEKRNATFFDSADKVNKNIKLFSIRVGDKDTLAAQGSKNLDELLKKHNINHELKMSGGGHTWINWRHYLNELAPRLFQ